MSSGSDEKIPSSFFILGKNDKIVMLIDKKTPNAQIIREYAWLHGLYSLNTLSRPLTSKMISDSKITNNLIIF